MIVDSSAMLAVILGESDGRLLAEAMVDAPVRRISAATWLETALVVDGRGDDIASSRFEALTERLQIEVVPVDAHVAALARVAHQQFGRGHHRAKLNFGDCMSYALAKARNEPLLFKGNDFSRTDIEPALKV